MTHNVNLDYITEVPIFLLSTHPWSQQAAYNHPRTDGTWFSTKENHCNIYWYQESYKRNIPWDPNTNTGQIHSDPGDNTYHIFVTAMEEDLVTKDKEYFY